MPITCRVELLGITRRSYAIYLCIRIITLRSRLDSLLMSGHLPTLISERKSITQTSPQLNAHPSSAPSAATTRPIQNYIPTQANPPLANSCVPAILRHICPSSKSIKTNPMKIQNNKSSNMLYKTTPETKKLNLTTKTNL